MMGETPKGRDGEHEEIFSFDANCLFHIKIILASLYAVFNMQI
jgi:hypothetical protein